MMRGPVIAAMLLSVAACAEHPLKRVVLDDKALQSTARPVVFRCPYRLATVEDARADGDRAGTYGFNKLELGDAVGLVTRYLQQAGLGAAASSPGRAVTIRLMHLYIGQNQEAKVPVAVLEVTYDGGKPFIVRSQKTSMAWSGSENEATKSLSAALQDATRVAAVKLDLACP